MTNHKKNNQRCSHLLKVVQDIEQLETGTRPTQARALILLAENRIPHFNKKHQRIETLDALIAAAKRWETKEKKS